MNSWSNVNVYETSIFTERERERGADIGWKEKKRKSKEWIFSRKKNLRKIQFLILEVSLKEDKEDKEVEKI